MPINAQIPLNAGKVPQIDVGSDWSRGAVLGHLALENQLLGARKAVGQDWQKATVNGQLQPRLFEQYVANDPRAAMEAQAGTAQALANVHQQLANRGISLDQAYEQAQHGADALGGLLASKKNVTQKDVTSLISDEVANGVMTPKQGATFISNAAAIPPDQLNNWVRAQYAMAQHGASVVQQMIHLVNTGSQTQLVQTNPLARGGVGVVGHIKNTLAPGTAATPTTYTGPGSVPTTTTIGAIAANHNRIPGSTAEHQNGLGGIRTKPLPNVVTERGTPISPSGTVQGLSPGAKASQVTNAQFNANLGNKWISDAGNVQQSLAALQGIGTFEQGAAPGTLNDALSTISNVFQNIGLNNGGLATNSQIVQKETSQLIMAQANKLGVPTDSKMSLTELGTPNMHMTPQAIQTTKGLLIGQFEYLRGRAQLWQDAKAENPSLTASQFQTEFNNKVPNADVFQYFNLPEEAQGKFWRSMKKNEKRSFANSLKWLHDHGIQFQ